MLKALRRSSAHRRAGERLWAAISERARDPRFFRDLGVPDSFNGRFDMVALHGWLVLDRLKAEGGREVSQALVNSLFYGFEDALREQGAGDMGMTRRIKKIADAFYGRLHAYGEAAGYDGLANALLRNVYGGEAAFRDAAGRLADYVVTVRSRLADASLVGGEVDFGTMPPGHQRHSHERK